MRVVAGQQQVALAGVAEGEVDVLARPVDALERLLVEQDLHAVLVGDAAQRHHQQLLVIGRHVGALEDRSDLELSRGDLVVAGLGRDAELEELAFAVEHVREHPVGDRAEVVVVELLPLGRFRAEQGASGVQQVGPAVEEALVDQEVLLLRSGERHDGVGLFVAEELENALGLGCHRLLGAQQRRLEVQRVTGHRDENRWNAKSIAVRIFQHVGRARDVPAGVSARLERGAQAAVREARGVRLALDQGLAGELGDRGTLAAGLEEAVVLFGGESGQRVEDVRVMRRTLLHRPVLHRHGDGVGHGRVERLGVVDRRHHRLVNGLRQPALHDRLAEDVRPEDLAGCLRRREAGRGRLIRLDGGDRLLPSTTSTHSYLLDSRSCLGGAGGSGPGRSPAKLSARCANHVSGA